MTSETNPESGTKNYTYDSDPTMCGNGAFTSNGDLVKTTDAAGNCVMRYYDSLHRLTDVGNSNSALNHCQRFRYDNSSGYPGSTKPAGLTNTLGRLIEAATDVCSSSNDAIMTDEWFSYTARGETSDLYESTPHSGGYYHSAATYWANGTLNQLNELNGNPNYGAAWNVDGEGRVSSTYNTYMNPLTGTTYNAASEPTQVNLGSGDSDTYGYDSNTGRMTQYKFNVNGQSVVGNVNWNPNGSLGSLAITDPFNSSNAQTCNYTHDDLSRIASANCGSIWSQTFTYADAFGNLTKSGNSSFSASYSPATNRMTTIGSSTPTYDGNGNVTNDFLHTYTWDAYGRPFTIDTVGVTYDALGRMVEQNRSGSYTQFVYSPTGFKMEIMSARSEQKSLVPLTGGAMAVYTSSGLDHYRHADWLGSARLESTQSRAILGDAAYAPYGEMYAQSGAPDASFTGMNQDTVSNEYDFPAREYGIQGRWPSPDPLGIGAVNLGDPQSWNRYAYVGNNPLGATDPTGLLLGPPPITPDPVTDIVIGIIDLLGSLFGLFGGHHHAPPPPHAPPAPQGGYGAGIDAYGTWDESLPAGVQVFPGPFGSIGSGCTYGGGSCGGMIYGLVNIQGSGGGILDQGGQFMFYALALGLMPRDELTTAQKQARDMGRVVTGLHKLEEPFQLLLPAAAGIGVGLFHYSLILPVLAAGCLEPTPAEPLTCGASLFAAGDLAVVGTGSIIASGVYLKKIAIPGLNNWWQGE